MVLGDHQIRHDEAGTFVHGCVNKETSQFDPLDIHTHIEVL